MFKVYSDNTLIADSRVDDLALINPVVNLEVNTAGSFEFTMPANHPRKNIVQRLTSIIRVERDDKIVFQGICTDDSVDFMGNRKISCEGELTYLNDSVLRPARYQGETVLSLLTKYINQHNAQVESRKQFTIGQVTVTDPNDYIYCYTNMNSTMKEIKEDLVDDYGGYLRVRYASGNKYIDYLAESTKQATQTIELGKNLINYKSNINETDIATRVIPLGAQLEEQVIEGLDTRIDIKSVNGGLDYLQSDDAISNLGIITKVVTFNEVTDKTILKRKGQEYLNVSQFENVTIEVSAVDFGMITDRVDTFELLDNIHVISQPHGMDRWFLLTKMVLNLNQPENDVFTLGEKKQLSLTAKTNNAITKVADKVESINPLNWLDRAKQEAKDLISGADGGYVVLNVNEDGQPFELLVMDEPTIEDATHIWRWNKNGLGYFPNGYDGSVGIAITMQGKIIADYIGAGTIEGSVIAKNLTMKGGSIQIETSGASIDKITLSYGNTKSYISPNYYLAENRNSDTLLGATINNAGFFASKIVNGTRVARAVLATWVDGHGGLYLCNTSGTQTIILDGSTGNIGISGNLSTGGQITDAFGARPVWAYNTNHYYRLYWADYLDLRIFIDETSWFSIPTSAISDRRLKENILDIEDDYIDAIGSIPIQQFNIIADPNKKLMFGVMAQDIVEGLKEHNLPDDNIKILKKAVINTDDDTEYYNVDYEQFLLARIAYDEKVIKEQENKIDDLENRLSKLEKLLSKEGE